MDRFEERLETDVEIDKECDTWVFKECRDIYSDELAALHISSVLRGDIRIEFQDADDEVYFSRIFINSSGDLRNILQNHWEDGKGGGGYYSLLPYTRLLYVGDNQGVLQDLIAYTQGSYKLNYPWKPKKLDKNIRIQIQHTSGNAPFVKGILGYFSNVEIVEALDFENTVDEDCYCHVFYNSESIGAKNLIVNARLSSPQHMIRFGHATREVRIPHIIIGPRGDFRAVVHNQWWNGLGGNGNRHGYYSLIQHADFITIENNPRALRDLLAYVEGRYEPGWRWQLQKLHWSTWIWVACAREDMPVIEALRRHFGTVVVSGSQLGPAEQELAGWDNLVPGDCSARVFTGCRRVRPVELIVRGRPAASVPVEFRDADGEVRFPKVFVEGVGSLRAVLQNRWEDGRGGGGDYSLLHHAQTLWVRNSPQTLRELLDYAEGRYELDGRWQWRELPRDMEVYTDCTQQSLPTVRRLRRYVGRVVVQRLSTILSPRNVVDEGSVECVFYGCRNVAPQDLTISVGAHSTVLFANADGEVHVPYVTIGPQGSLESVVYNKWSSGRGDKAQKCARFSLLPHVRILTIKDNHRALLDLLEYVEGSWELIEGWKQEKLDRGMIICVCCNKKSLPIVQCLSEYFDTVGVQRLEMDLERDNVVDKSCGQLVFVNCDAVQSRSLTVNANISNPLWQLQFRDAVGEVCIPYIRIGKDGHLRTILQNRWDGENGQHGLFSLLSHAKQLDVGNNPRVLQELLSYAVEQGRDACLRMDVQIEVDFTKEVLPTMTMLKHYFRAVVVRELRKTLGADNTVDVDCERCVFTYCGAVQPQSLTVDAEISSGEIVYHGSDGEVFVPRVTIGRWGDFESIVRNSWCSDEWGAGGEEGRYSMVWGVQELTIEDNGRAILDLIRYVEGEYQAGVGWEVKGLPAETRVVIQQSDYAAPAVAQLAAYFHHVTVNGRPAQ